MDRVGGEGCGYVIGSSGKKANSGLCLNANKVPAVRPRAFSGPSQRKDDYVNRAFRVKTKRQQSSIADQVPITLALSSALELGSITGLQRIQSSSSATNLDHSFLRSPWSLARFSRSSLEKSELQQQTFI
ncbi:hypothetical protein E4U61_007476 [Claviceps capensis]|nr:hypothetical protein E4U61_007476 [Claviceps capensis]